MGAPAVVAYSAAAHVTDDKLSKIRRLDVLAKARGQKLSQMAIVWVLRHPEMTSALIGASKVAQIEDAVLALSNTHFSDSELREIDAIVAE